MTQLPLSEKAYNEMIDDLRDEKMTQGEYVSSAVNQHAAALGFENRKQAWILSPFDTWGKNPYYTGPPVPHPDDDWID